MPQINLNPGETLSQLSDRIFNGDVSRFTEILELNPDLDVFSELPADISVNIPSADQILNFARPALTRISQSVGGAGRFLSNAERAINQVSGSLPPELQGYAKEALEVVGELNGVRGEIEQAIASAEEQLRSYENQAVQLVPWLLGRR